MDSLLNYKAVAKIFGVCERTVQSLYYAGKLKGIKIGKQVRFTEEALKEYLKEAQQ